jgi:hypothetical protein
MAEEAVTPGVVDSEEEAVSTHSGNGIQSAVEEFEALVRELDCFYDPISFVELTDPVLIHGEGITYERSSLARWAANLSLQGKPVLSPIKNIPFRYPEDVTEQETMKEAINRIVQMLKKNDHFRTLFPNPPNDSIRTLVSVQFDNCPKGVMSDIFVDLDAISKLELVQSLNLRTPQIIVIGSEKAGKSTLLERLTFFPIFPMRKEMSTLCAIRVHLRRKENSNCATVHVRNRATGEIDPIREITPMPLESLASFLQKLMDEMSIAFAESDAGKEKMKDVRFQKKKPIIVDREIVIKVEVPYCPDLDLLDLPGIVAQPDFLRLDTYELAKDIIQKEKDHSIFMLVEKASTPFTHCTTLDILPKELHDKTIGVITHLDSVPSEDGRFVDELIMEKLDPENENYVTLGSSWMGCAGKTPLGVSTKSPKMYSNHMARLFDTERLESRCLITNYTDCVARWPGCFGMAAIRKRVIDEFEQFISKHWVDNMTASLKTKFIEISDKNFSLGCPMPNLAEYRLLVEDLRAKVPHLFPVEEYNAAKMLELSSTATYKKIIEDRSTLVCSRGDWLKLNECDDLWNAKDRLAGYFLPSDDISFDKSIEKVRVIEAEVFIIFQSIIDSLLEHTDRVSTLFVDAALKHAEGQTASQTPPPPVEAQPVATGWYQTVSYFGSLGRAVYSKVTGYRGLENVDKNEQTAVLKVDRFEGLLEQYSTYMAACMREIRTKFAQNARVFIESHRSRLLHRPYCRRGHDILVRLEWRTDIIKIGDDILSIWADSVLSQIHTFTTSWNIPDSCIQEKTSEERVGLLKEMVDVVRALTALKSLKLKCVAAETARAQQA